MSDHDAMLAALDANIADIATFAAAGNAFNPVITAAVAYARASVWVRAAWRGTGNYADRGPSDNAQEAAWAALRDAVVAKAAAQ